MAELITGLVGPGNTATADGSTPVFRMGKQNEAIVSSLHADLYEAAYRKTLFYAFNSLQTLSVVGTAITGSIIWNGSASVNLHLVKAQLSVPVTSASLLGIGLATTTPGAQTSAPTTTTAATKTGSTFLGQASSAATAYSIATCLATLTVASLAHNTAAIATVGIDGLWVDLNGWIVPPYTAVHLSALGGASASSAVTSTIMWEEIPI